MLLPRSPVGASVPPFPKNLVPLLVNASSTMSGPSAIETLDMTNGWSGATTGTVITSFVTPRTESLLFQSVFGLFSLGINFKLQIGATYQFPGPYYFKPIGTITRSNPPSMFYGGYVHSYSGASGILGNINDPSDHVQIAYFPDIDAIWCEGEWHGYLYDAWILNDPSPRIVVATKSRQPKTIIRFKGQDLTLIPNLANSNIYHNTPTPAGSIRPQVDLSSEACQEGVWHLIGAAHGLMAASAAIMAGGGIISVAETAGAGAVLVLSAGLMPALVAVGFFCGVAFATAELIQGFSKTAGACQDKTPMSPVITKNPGGPYVSYTPFNEPMNWGDAGDIPDGPPEQGGRQTGQCAANDWECIRAK